MRVFLVREEPIFLLSAVMASAKPEFCVDCELICWLRRSRDSLSALHVLVTSLLRELIFVLMVECSVFFADAIMEAVVDAVMRSCSNT